MQPTNKQTGDTGAWDGSSIGVEHRVDPLVEIWTKLLKKQEVGQDLYTDNIYYPYHLLT